MRTCLLGLLLLLPLNGCSNSLSEYGSNDQVPPTPEGFSQPGSPMGNQY